VVYNRTVLITFKEVSIVHNTKVNSFLLDIPCTNPFSSKVFDIVSFDIASLDLSAVLNWYYLISVLKDF
jgi:hypothetical protein